MEKLVWFLRTYGSRQDSYARSRRVLVEGSAGESLEIRRSIRTESSNLLSGSELWHRFDHPKNVPVLNELKDLWLV